MYYAHNIRVASTAETQTDAETTTDTEGVCTAAFLCGRLFQHVCFQHAFNVPQNRCTS